MYMIITNSYIVHKCFSQWVKVPGSPDYMYTYFVSPGHKSPTYGAKESSALDQGPTIFLFPSKCSKAFS